MKVCKICGINKELNEYYSNGFSKSGRKYKPECIECSKPMRYQDFYAKIADIVKEWKCVLCGYDEFKQGLEFHHLDPSGKDFDIAGSKTISIDRLRREINKCVLLCGTCHREIHAGVRFMGQ
jgi:hypothetical protein